MKDIFQTLELLNSQIKGINEYELVSLEDAFKRILFEDIYSTKNLPSFDNSALDGYAFNFSDKDSSLQICGTIFAGDKTEIILKNNECYKIMTGAKIPKNADTILPLECEKIELGKLIVSDEIKQFNALRFKGEELKKNELILKRGECLNAAKIMLLASQGIYKVKVVRQVQIAVFSSGNELKEPWQVASEEQIYNANALGIMKLFDKNAFKTSYLGIIKDDFNATKNALDNAIADLLITSGGASVGEADFMKKALLELGFKPIFEGLRAKMAKPTKLYKRNETLLLILPGNPMSAFLSCLIFGRKIANLLSGFSGGTRKFKGILSKDIKFKSGRNNFLMGELIDGRFEVIEKIGPGMILPLVNSSFLFIADEKTELLKAGVELELLGF